MLSVITGSLLAVHIFVDFAMAIAILAKLNTEH